MTQKSTNNLLIITSLKNQESVTYGKFNIYILHKDTIVDMDAIWEKGLLELTQVLILAEPNVTQWSLITQNIKKNKTQVINLTTAKPLGEVETENKEL